jgi:hypothetical protein
MTGLGFDAVLLANRFLFTVPKNGGLNLSSFSGIMVGTEVAPNDPAFKVPRAEAIGWSLARQGGGVSCPN